MIKNKEDLKKWLKYEQNIYGLFGFKSVIKRIIHDEISVIWKYQKLLRKTEYYKNCNKKIKFWISLTKLNRYRNKYGLHIALNSCDKGLHIMHLGSILINGKAKVGRDCSIHINTSIVARGNDDTVPIIGDNVVIGVGSTIVGGIKIANGIAIGASALVNKSFEEENIAIAGVPAKKISNNGKNTWGKNE